MPSVHFSGAMSQAARNYLMQTMTIEDRAELRKRLIQYVQDNPVGEPPAKSMKFKASTGTFNVRMQSTSSASSRDLRTADGGLTTQICFTSEDSAAFHQGITSGSLEATWVVSVGKRLVQVDAGHQLEEAKDLHELEGHASVLPVASTALSRALRSVHRVFENTRSVAQWDKTNETNLQAQLKVSFQSAASATGTALSKNADAGAAAGGAPGAEGAAGGGGAPAAHLCQS